MQTDDVASLRRTVRGALILPAPGVVSSADLVTMPENQWRALRNRISDGHNGHPNGLEARCMFPGCGGHVYVSERAKGRNRYPYFAHRQGEGLGCPWHPRSKLTPDEVRAAQYQGNQVSAAHEFICAELDRLVRRDVRFQAAEIDRTYVAGEQGQRGRYPDVRFRWEGFPECVCEVQLSNTFQPEISERGIFYEGKGMPLIWVLHGVEPRLDNLPSSFRDVILRHKNNAFALDREAIAASENENTLILKCFLLDKGGSVVETHLVRFDELRFPNRGLPYFRNMLLPDVGSFRARRLPWIDALKELKEETDGNWYTSSMVLPQVLRAFNTLPRPMEDAEERYDFARLVAITMTLLSEAGGHYQDLVYRQKPNATAALNTFLSRGGPQQGCAEAIRTLVDRSPLAGKLKPTVREHIMRAIAVEPNQVRPRHPFYDALSWLVPEIFDDVMREELELGDALPGWASVRSR